MSRRKRTPEENEKRLKMRQWHFTQEASLEMQEKKRNAAKHN